MGFLLFLACGIGLGLAGLVQLWRNAGSQLFVAGAGLVGMVAVLCFTSEAWYSLLNLSSGDGQVFIGIYFVGLAAVGLVMVMGLCAALVTAFRPERKISSDGEPATQQDTE